MTDVKVLNAKIVKCNIVPTNDYEDFNVELTINTTFRDERFLHLIGAKDHLLDFLAILNVESWQSLNGSYIRLKIKDKGVMELGNILEDNWLICNTPKCVRCTISCERPIMYRAEI
jgi:hypothetical protein